MAPPQGPSRPGRQLVVLAAIFVILYAIVYFGGSGSLHNRFAPRLGLDLVGGTRVTMQAKTEDGKPPPANSLEQARQIIERPARQSAAPDLHDDRLRELSVHER